VRRGMLLGGKYRLVERLGRGGMGEVWSADDHQLGRRVAVKILHADLSSDRVVAARLRREARTAAALQHPGITVVHDIGEHEGHPYFVMELLEGTNFAELLADNPGGLPVARVASLMAPVAEALAYAHRKGVVHRDIKPANLVELSEGGVKICDFGLSRYAGAGSSLTGTGGALGTPAYMAPEQYAGRSADARSDLYSLGCTLYALLAGRPPFPGPTMVDMMRQHLMEPPPDLAERRPDVPADLHRLLRRLLAKDPYDRPASAEEVHRVVGALAGPARRRPDPPADPVPEPRPAERPARLSPARRPWRLPSPPMPADEGRGADRIETTSTPIRMRGGLVPGHPSWPGPPSGASCAATLACAVPVLAAVFSPDGRLLATGGEGDAALLWEVGTRRAVAAFEDHPAGIRAVAFSPDGRLLATGGDDEVVRLWSVTAHRLVTVLKGHAGGVSALAFSPDGARLAVGGGNRAVKVWDLAALRTVAAPKAPAGGVCALAFSPDGARLAAAVRNERVLLWDAAAFRTVTELRGHSGPVRAVAFRPDGTTLATGGEDGTARLWDLATRYTIAPLKGHAGPVRSVAFRSDGATLATGGDDGTARLWDGANGAPTATLTGHAGPVRAVAFGPEGMTLATGSLDRTVRLWQLH